MSHNIQYYTYKETTDKNVITSELNEYVEKSTWEEGGNGLVHPIRFIDEVLPDYDAGVEYIQQHDKGWYDCLAVKFKTYPNDKTTKKLDDLTAKFNEAHGKFAAAANKVVVKDFKSEFIGCKHCGSKIKKEYIKTNYCPVCNKDMRSDAVKDKISQLHKRQQQLADAIKEEKRKISVKYGETMWLVKIEYHT